MQHSLGGADTTGISTVMLTITHQNNTHKLSLNSENDLNNEQMVVGDIQ